MFKKVLISLGSNLGDRFSYISKAIAGLNKIQNIKIMSKSSLMETSPVGISGQPTYLNIILLIETDMQPIQLLKEIKALEQVLGRQNRGRWEEREIDIDILVYEGVTLKTPELCIPHKELANRLFVLKGCSEVWPECIIDEYNSTVKSLYLSRKEALCKDQIVLDTKQ